MKRPVACLSASDVLCASALRDQYFNVVRDSHALVWLLVDGYSGRLCALLHMERTPTTLTLLALYVATDDLVKLIHERLLLLLVAFADRRGLEIESKAPKSAVPEFLWAFLGFLWHPERNLLIRPCMREMANSFEVLGAVEQQMSRVIDRQRTLVSAKGANISPDEPKNTAATNGTPAPNTVAPSPTPLCPSA